MSGREEQDREEQSEQEMPPRRCWCVADDFVDLTERWKEESPEEVEKKEYDPTQRIEADRILVIHPSYCCGYRPCRHPPAKSPNPSGDPVYPPKCPYDPGMLS